MNSDKRQILPNKNTVKLFLGFILLTDDVFAEGEIAERKVLKVKFGDFFNVFLDKYITTT